MFSIRKDSVFEQLPSTHALTNTEPATQIFPSFRESLSKNDCGNFPRSWAVWKPEAAVSTVTGEDSGNRA
jgi:hypothetical protein